MPAKFEYNPMTHFGYKRNGNGDLGGFTIRNFEDRERQGTWSK